MTTQATPADVAAAASAKQDPPQDPPNAAQDANSSQSDAGTEQGTSDRSSGDEDDEEDGYPKDTPTADMTVEQREAYWKSLARKHEKQSKALERERTSLQQERDNLKKATESDVERQIREAREEAALEARTEVRDSTLRSMYRMALRNNGVKEEAIDSIVEEVNFSVFTTTDGEIDDDRLAQSAQRAAGTAGPRKFPDMGQDKVSAKRLTGLAAGRKAYQETHQNNKD